MKSDILFFTFHILIYSELAGIEDGPVEEFRYSDVAEKTYFTVIKPTLANQGNYR